MTRAYYNEIDPFCCNWLSNLMDAGLITPGVIDDRSIKEVQAADLAGFHRVHMFAGIAGWDYALNLAGWGSGEVWTGSAPCQPFSVAGKGLGEDDPRHLWPDFCRLIRECRPATVFGEQVARSAGLRWLDGVFADLETSGYACGAADIAAAGVGAPHIRQRLFWVADAELGKGGQRHPADVLGRRANNPKKIGVGGVHRSGLVNANGCGVLGDRRGQDAGPASSAATEARQQRVRDDAESAGAADGLGDAGRVQRKQAQHEVGDGPAAGTSWHDFDLVRCVEPTKEPGRFVEKWRRVEPGTLPLAYGLPARVGRLRGYGNAIVPQVAAEFVAAYAECRN